MNQIAPSAAIGFIHCQGPELMSCGWRCADPSGYLDDLHGLLGTTATQEPAWNDYVDAVKLRPSRCSTCLSRCTNQWA